MTSPRGRGVGAGGRVLPRTAGVHRSRAAAGERHGPDALARQYACTRDAGVRAALVDICTPLVVGVASAYPTPNLRDDLIQEGFLGLLRAIERYDPGRGTPFLAFARHFIRGGVSHYLRDHRWLLRPGRSAAQAPRTFSLAAVQDGERDGAVPPWVTSAGGRGDSWDDRIVLTAALAALPPLHRVVIFYSYFVGLTQVEVAGRVGISQKHVSRMLAGALLRLRSALTCAEQCGQAPTLCLHRNGP